MIRSRSPIADGNLRVSWSDVAKPDAQDWVGLFKVGGDDSTRAAFMFLPGTANGEVTFPIPQGFTPKLLTGEYEMRLFTAGRWELIGRSDLACTVALDVIGGQFARTDPDGAGNFAPKALRGSGYPISFVAHSHCAGDQLLPRLG